MSRVPRAATATAVTTTAAVATAATVFRGFNVRNTSAGTAVYNVYDHASAASGTVLASVSLAAGASTTILDTGGVYAENGLYFEAGDTCVGAVYEGTVV